MLKKIWISSFDARLDRLRGRLPRRLAAVAVLLAVANCAVNPVTGEREVALVSTERQIALGKDNYGPAQQMQGGLYQVDPGVTEYVREVGNRLAAASGVNLPYEFVVLNSSVPNAWALPGGKLAVNRGLLTELESEAELAAVLGHEIVHAAGRHGAQAMERGMLAQAVLLGVAIGTSSTEYGQVLVGGAAAATGLVTQRYGRDAEREADYYGTRYLAKAGYDPMASATLQETFVRLSESEAKQTSWLEGLFASHPPSAERVANNRKLAEELRAEGLAGTELGRERYQAAIARLREDAPAYAAADQAREALAKDRPEEAEASVRKAIALQDGEASFHGLLGDLQRKRSNYAAAIKSYDAAIARDPEYFAYYLGRGMAHRNQGEGTLAHADFDRSVKLLPTAIAYNELGRMAEASGNVDQALRMFEAAGKSDSAAGAAARESSMRLDLPRNPGRYLQAHVERDGRGRLLLAVNNPTAGAVVDVAVRIEMLDRDGKRQDGTRHIRRVEAGATEWVVLLQDATALADARAGVVAARAAD